MDHVRARTPGSLNGKAPKNHGAGRRCACGTRINQYHKGDKCGLCERDPDRAARVAAEREREQADMLRRNKWKSEDYPDGCSECPDGEKLLRRHAGRGLCSLHYQRARKEAARLAEAEAAAMTNGDKLDEHLDEASRGERHEHTDECIEPTGPNSGLLRCSVPAENLVDLGPKPEICTEGSCPDCGEDEVSSTTSGGEAVYTTLKCGNTREYRKGEVAYSGDCGQRILEPRELGTPSEREGRLEVTDGEPGYPHRAVFPEGPEGDEAYERACVEFEGDTRTVLVERASCCGTRPDGEPCTGDCKVDVDCVGQVALQCCGQRPEGDMDCSNCPLDAEAPEADPDMLQRALAAAERAVAYKVNLDPEARAIDAIAKALEPLDEAARQRVIDWAWSKFIPPTS